MKIFIVAYFIITSLGVSSNVWIAVLVGAIGGIVVGLTTEYYTGGKPVRKIAEGGETGAATLMITGLAVGMQSVAIPVLAIVVIIFTANSFAGLYGVGMAAVGMLSTVGITMEIVFNLPFELGKYFSFAPSEHEKLKRIAKNKIMNKYFFISLSLTQVSQAIFCLLNILTLLRLQWRYS